VVSLAAVSVNVERYESPREHQAQPVHAGRHHPADTARPAMRACVLVPAFDAAASIAEVIAEVRRALPEVCEADPRALIVIDDGSSDGTGAIAARGGAHVVAHGKNRGKGAALATGLGTARALGFDVAVSIDADGQHPGESARMVLRASDDPGALVLGIRDLERDGAPGANRFSNGISNFFLSRFTGVTLADTQCGLRRYPVEPVLALGTRAEGYAFEAEVILRAVAAKMPIVQVSVPVFYPPEEERISHFDRVKDPARIVAVVVRTLHELYRG
jgi:glycosyltransferase involved in cell wall biosynthesis